MSMLWCFRLAIFRKYGFKPHEEIRSDKNCKNDDDPLQDIDTIPEHILNDEVLYRRYLQENVFNDNDDKDSSSEEEDKHAVKKDPKSGSFSSLMNIFSTVKQSVISKNVDDSRQNLDKVWFYFRFTSVVDKKKV